jgi:hypothetical protein
MLAFIACPIVAITLSFAFGEDADSPLGDGMILGLLVLAIPLWPITMPLWAIYVVKRHRDAVADRDAGIGALRPEARTVPAAVGYGLAVSGLNVPIPDARPSEKCRACRSTDWAQTAPVRYRFGAVGTSFVCQHCGATCNFDIAGGEWRPTFPERVRPEWS